MNALKFGRRAELVTDRDRKKFDLAPKVTFKALASKRKADELGKEAEVPIADWIDIGVLDADNQPLYLEKRRIERNKRRSPSLSGSCQCGRDRSLQQADRSPSQGQHSARGDRVRRALMPSHGPFK